MSSYLDDLIRQAEAAKLRGVSRSAIGDLIKRGKLKGHKVGSVVFLSRREVLNYTPEVGGRPARKKEKV
jgi:excisionase family DNA binding protein